MCPGKPNEGRPARQSGRASPIVEVKALVNLPYVLHIDDGKYCVNIEAWAKNQRGAISMPPHVSTVLLPSRENGPVVYPNPSPKLMQEVSRARPLDDLIREGLI